VTLPEEKRLITAASRGHLEHSSNNDAVININKENNAAVSFVIDAHSHFRAVLTTSLITLRYIMCTTQPVGSKDNIFVLYCIHKATGLNPGMFSDNSNRLLCTIHASYRRRP